MQQPESLDGRQVLLAGACVFLLVVHMLFPKAGIDATTIYLLILTAVVLYGQELTTWLSSFHRSNPSAGNPTEAPVETEQSEDADVRQLAYAVEHARTAVRVGDYDAGSPAVAQKTQEILRDAAGNPRAALLLLWAELELAVRGAARTRGIESAQDGGADTAALVREMAARNFVPDPLITAFEDFRRIRNEVTQGRPQPASETTLWTLVDIGAALLALLPPPRLAQE